VISGAVAGISVFLVFRFVGCPVFRLDVFQMRAAEGLGYAFATSSSVIYNDFDKAMLSHYGLNLENGIYTMAYRVIDVATIPFYSLRDALLPELFRNGVDQVRSTAGRSIRILKRTAPVGVICAGVLLAFAPIPSRLLGPGFQQTTDAIRWLCTIPILRSVHVMTGSALTGSGHQGRRTAAQLTAAGLNFCLNLWLIPLMCWRGAALASVITDGILALLCWSLLHYTCSAGPQNCQVPPTIKADAASGVRA
jgi:O-antigen/teichoic acid export membrane protein